MLLRIKIISTTLLGSILLLIFLCLGSQNLNQRHSINLGLTSTAPLPNGFIIGVSTIIGIICGGTFSSLIMPLEQDLEWNWFIF